MTASFNAFFQTWFMRFVYDVHAVCAIRMKLNNEYVTEILKLTFGAILAPKATEYGTYNLGCLPHLSFNLGNLDRLIRPFF